MSSASPANLIGQQQTAGQFNVVEKASSFGSTAALVDQQQSAVSSSIIEGPTYSASPASLIDQQQTAGPSSAVEDQLRKQIAGSEDEIRHLKLNQDPNIEAVKYTLLCEELAQLREKTLDLRVELQVAQEGQRLLEGKLKKHLALESEHEKCKTMIQKAIENLSLGLGLSNGESANLRLSAGVTADASLPQRQSVSRLALEKACGTPSALQIGNETHPSGFLSGNSGGSPVQANIFGQSPIRPSTAQYLFVPPGASQTSQPHSPMPPFLVSTPSAFLPQLTFGDPEPRKRFRISYNKGTVSFSFPGFYNGEEQSFEEARLRRYEFYKHPELSELFGTSKAFTPRTLFNGSPLPLGQSFFQQSNKRKIGNEMGGWEGQPPRSVDTAGASSEGFRNRAKPEGDATTNVTSAIKDTGKHHARDELSASSH